MLTHSHTLSYSHSHKLSNVFLHAPPPPPNRNVYASSKTFNRKMKQFGRDLNLCGHWCGMSRATSKHLYSAADVEGHLGVDGEFYLLDFSRTLPPVSPQKKAFNGHLYRMFRREFLLAYQNAPLCPDAFSGFVMADRDALRYNEEIVRADTHLRESVCPRFAKQLMYTVLEANAQGSVSSVSLSSEFHKSGVNMRFVLVLGCVCVCVCVWVWVWVCVLCVYVCDFFDDDIRGDPQLLECGCVYH
jgi:Clustered mitochondria